jgi:predicted cobalt transporter CbtA
MIYARQMAAAIAKIAHVIASLGVRIIVPFLIELVVAGIGFALGVVFGLAGMATLPEVPAIPMPSSSNIIRQARSDQACGG